MDLSTSYMGLELPHPFVCGASPLADGLDTVRRLEDAGAAAIVMRSIFAEQIEREQIAAFIHLESHGGSFAEAMTYFPTPDRFALGPDDYLEQLRRIREAVKIPVIASLNAVAPGIWLEYPAMFEKIGADGIELNLYHVATDPDASASDVEDQMLDLVREVKSRVKIPVAVKLSPFFTAFAHFARRLDQAGADALVIFNRFYQPDLDPEELRVVPSLHLSRSAELLLRLRWLAILSGRVKASLGVTGGVHTGLCGVKAVMAGADAVQVVSALLGRGPEYIGTLRKEMADWMEEHEYVSLAQMKGSMSLATCPDPAVYERANYMMVLQGWRDL